MYTCILNYVYMQDNYVHMQDNYVYINHIIFFHTSQNICSAMKNLCSDVPSGPPYLLDLSISLNPLTATFDNITVF